jgi:hypothetical protein
MTTNLNDLTDRIMKALVQDAYETNDITQLIDTALGQRATIENLAADNERLTQALGIAGSHITSLEKQVESLEPFSHLQQYSEESVN